MMDDLYTRFRAYAMPNGGISMSYLVDSSFTLIEARYNADNIGKIKNELELAGCKEIDLLHISNWDDDCCNSEELPQLLKDLQPLEVEIPAYEPTDENGMTCRKIIREFCSRSHIAELFEAGPRSLVNPITLPDVDFTDIIFSPLQYYQECYDNSVVKIFRQGKFLVLNASKSNRASEVLQLLKQTKLASSVEILVVYNQESLISNCYIGELFLRGVNPEMIALAGGKPELMVKSDNSLEKRGIRASRTEQGDILVRYGIMSRKGIPNLEKNNTVCNGDYKKLADA